MLRLVFCSLFKLFLPLLCLIVKYYKKHTFDMKHIKTLSLILTILTSAPSMAPCSRVVLCGDSVDVVVVGRTLDWRTPIPTNIYVYPAGMARVSMPDGPRFEWVSRYNSVLAVSYDSGVTEGMNQCGLVVNGLFCRGSSYRVAPAGSDTPVMSLALFVSYFLDNFATVDEVEAFLDENDFGMEASDFDGGTATLLHWAITDATGNTLIMEFVGGELQVYVDRNYRVLTNEPQFPAMQSILSYWMGIGGNNMLPGGVRSSDRFVRASYFVNHVPAPRSADEAVAVASSIINNVSVPMGYEIPGQPNLSSTQWRSISDASRGRYYMQFADSGGLFYVDLSTLELSSGKVLKLDTSNHADFFGCVNHLLRPSAPFTPHW